MRIGPRTYLERAVVAYCGRVWMSYLVDEAQAHVDRQDGGCGPLRKCLVIVRVPKGPRL